MAEKTTRCEHIDPSQMVAVLEASGWKVKGAGNAAERLGLKSSTLRYRMKVLGILRLDKCRQTSRNGSRDEFTSLSMISSASLGERERPVQNCNSD